MASGRPVWAVDGTVMPPTVRSGRFGRSRGVTLIGSDTAPLLLGSRSVPALSVAVAITRYEAGAVVVAGIVSVVVSVLEAPAFRLVSDRVASATSPASSLASLDRKKRSAY